MTVGAVVLAAGRSERMRRPKPLLACRETTFLGAILSTLSSAGVAVVRVVLGHGAQDVLREVRLPEGTFVVNPSYDDGMLSSVRCGIRSIPEGVENLLLWPVDHPLVSAGTVRALLAESRRSGAPIVVPARDGRRGHPALFSMRLAPELLAAPDALGARAVLHAHAGEVRTIEVDDGGILADIDTPEAYERAFGRPIP